jgi:nucleoside-diphosphate-sugar epimerase
MRMLITGNMGYVGPVLTRFLRENLVDAELIGFDTAYFAHSLTGASLLPEALLDRQVFGDIREFPTELLDQVDAVVHLSAISNDPMGNKFEAVTGEINRDATVRLAQMAAERKVKSFIFASSCSMYGYAEGGARKESDPTKPLTAYARSKIGSEQALAQLDRNDMLVTSLRFATACGMSDRLRLDLVLNDFVACATASGEITVLSDGTPWRPLIDVEDMARAILWAVRRKRENGGEFLAVNAGRDESNYQVRDLAAAVGAPGARDESFNQHQCAPRPALLSSGLFAVPVAGPRIRPTSVARSIDHALARRTRRHRFRGQRLPRLAFHAAQDAGAPHGHRPPR